MIIAGWVLSTILMILIVVTTLDHLDVFSTNDTFYGADYLSALRVGILVAFPVFLFLVSGKRKFALIMCGGENSGAVS
jgi:hypothetical protein